EALVAQFCGGRTLPPRPLWVQETMIGEARLRRRPQHRSLLSQQRRHVSVCDAAEQGAMLQFGLKLGHPGDVRCMTALPPKDGVHPRSCYVAFVPICM